MRSATASGSLATPSTSRSGDLTRRKIRAGGVALSRDGRQMAFIARRADGTPMIFVRKMDEIEARPLAGTDNALSPFWSPDGERLAFCQQQKLKQIHLAGR